MRRQIPLLPLILIVAINAVSFAVFPRVGNSVGADTGTDGYKEIAENVVRGNGFVYALNRPSTMMAGYMKREPMYPLWLSMILATTGSLTPGVLCLFQTPLCVLSCYLLYLLGVRMFDVRTGTIASHMHFAPHFVGIRRFASGVAIPVILWSYSSSMGSSTTSAPRALRRMVSWNRHDSRVCAAPVSARVGRVSLTPSGESVCVAVLILGFASVDSLWLRNCNLRRDSPIHDNERVIFF
jgi:hypothetical protein